MQMYHLLKGPILCLNVSKDDHSHLIGKKGSFHKQLQSASKTLIHFPEIVKKDQAKSTADGESSMLNPEIEQEVLITPGEIELKREPCLPEAEDRLVQVLTASMQNIRMNQLLAFKMIFPTLSASFASVEKELDRIAAVASQESISIAVEKEPPTTLVIRGIMENASKVVFIVNLIKESLSNQLKLPMAKLYTTDHIASVNWTKLVHAAGSAIIRNYPMKMQQASPATVLSTFLKGIGITVEYQSNSRVVISGQDPMKILETKAQLTMSLPISLLVSSNSVAANLSDLAAVRFLEEFYSVRVSTNIGSSFGCPNAALSDRSSVAFRRFFVGQKVALETYESNFGALFEAKWLLSQKNLPQLLTLWQKGRMLWPKDASSDLPSYLRSPREFSQISMRISSPPVQGPIQYPRREITHPVKSVLQISPPRIRNQIFNASSMACDQFNSTPAGSPVSSALQVPYPDPFACWTPIKPKAGDSKPGAIACSLEPEEDLSLFSSLRVSENGLQCASGSMSFCTSTWNTSDLELQEPFQPGSM